MRNDTSSVADSGADGKWRRTISARDWFTLFGNRQSSLAWSTYPIQDKDIYRLAPTLPQSAALETILYWFKEQLAAAHQKSIDDWYRDRTVMEPRQTFDWPGTNYFVKRCGLSAKATTRLVDRMQQFGLLVISDTKAERENLPFGDLRAKRYWAKRRQARLTCVVGEYGDGTMSICVNKEAFDGAKEGVSRSHSNGVFAQTYHRHDTSTGSKPRSLGQTNGTFGQKLTPPSKILLEIRGIKHATNTLSLDLLRAKEIEVSSSLLGVGKESVGCAASDEGFAGLPWPTRPAHLRDPNDGPYYVPRIDLPTYYYPGVRLHPPLDEPGEVRGSAAAFQVLSGYREAYRDHFGEEYKDRYTTRRNIHQRKWFKKAVQAWKMFAEHGQCRPADWARWAFKFSQMIANKKGKESFPSAFQVIMAPSYIEKRLGQCWADSRPDGILCEDQHIDGVGGFYREQELRRDECMALNSGLMTHPGVPPASWDRGADAWYCDKRLEEVANGHLDPNDKWRKISDAERTRIVETAKHRDPSIVFRGIQ